MTVHQLYRLAVFSWLLWSCVNAWTPSSSDCTNKELSTLNRRHFLLTSPTLLIPSAAIAADPRPRSIDAGSGVDVSVDTRNTVLSDPSNLVFPAALQGRWKSQRVVVSVEGDFYQAQSAWKALGGGATNKNSFGSTTPEEYETHLISASNNQYAVLDRGYEWSSRSRQASNAATWNLNQPNLLQTQSNTEIAVVQRSVILPNPDQGIVAGGQELIRITEGPFVRAALIKQRFRQGSSPDVIEGLEILKTFRVLDGIAGTEFPTSTTKSQLKLTRIGPLAEEMQQLVSATSASSLYFDGSNWY